MVGDGPGPRDFLRRMAGHVTEFILCGARPVQPHHASMLDLLLFRTSAATFVICLYPRRGYVLIKADYSQAQMRILAHLSGDGELIRVFNDPDGDVHAETSEWLKLNDRNVAKEINFAICFGMGPAALCTKINSLKEKQGRTDFINLDSAQSYIDGFYARYPKVREFFVQEWQRLKQLAVKDRVVRSLIGRERRFERRLTSEAERQFKVTWPQQIEADLIKTAMVRLDRIFNRRGMVARIFMMIHDAFWVECPV